MIVHSSFLAKEQYWWNKASQTCVSLKIDGTHIAALSTINNAECTKRVAK